MAISLAASNGTRRQRFVIDDQGANECPKLCYLMTLDLDIRVRASVVARSNGHTRRSVMRTSAGNDSFHKVRDVMQFALLRVKLDAEAFHSSTLYDFLRWLTRVQLHRPALDKQGAFHA